MGFSKNEGLYGEKVYLPCDKGDFISTDDLIIYLQDYARGEVNEGDLDENTHFKMKRYEVGGIVFYLENRGSISLIVAPKDEQTKSMLETKLNFGLGEVVDTRKEIIKNDSIVNAFELYVNSTGNNERIELYGDKF